MIKSITKLKEEERIYSTMRIVKEMTKKGKWSLHSQIGGFYDLLGTKSKRKWELQILFHKPVVQYFKKKLFPVGYHEYY